MRCRPLAEKGVAGTPSNMNQTLRQLLVTILTALVLAASTNAQSSVSPSKVGPNEDRSGFWTWPANARVKVFIVAGHFKAEELPHLLAPFEKWNASGRLTNTGVEFKFVGEVRKPEQCESCLTLKRGAVLDEKQRHVTELHAFSARSDRIITHASIVIDSRLTYRKSLRSAVAHEIGHSFGLSDCYNCAARSTVMLQLTALNVWNEMEGPTSLDIAQVRQAYNELSVRSLRVVSVDEGEEPIDDDTPVVVPEP